MDLVINNLFVTNKRKIILYISVLNVYIAVIIYSYYMEVKETQERNRLDQIQLATQQYDQRPTSVGLSGLLESRKHYRVHPSST